MLGKFSNRTVLLLVTFITNNQLPISSNIFQIGTQITNCLWIKLTWRTCKTMLKSREKPKRRSISMTAASFHAPQQVAYLQPPTSSLFNSLRINKIWMLVLPRSWIVWMRLKSWEFRKWICQCSHHCQLTKMPSKWCSKPSNLLAQSRPRTSWA